MDARTGKNTQASRPDIFGYHDYREFLRDWFTYLKQTQKGFSLRSLAREAKLASGYMSMVLAGNRNLSAKALERCSRFLNLNARERSYLDLLRILGDSDSPEARKEAFEKIQKYRSYRQVNPREMEVYRYLTSWYFVVIREMALLPGFKADAKWIQARLKWKVSLKEVQQALDFLISSGFMEVDVEGSVRLPQKNVECIGGVYKLALANFHREMLGKATDALSDVPRDKRSVTGHSMPISEKNYPKVVEILDKALREIAELEETDNASNPIYHVALAAFPLTELKNGKSEKKDEPEGNEPATPADTKEEGGEPWDK